MLHLEPQQRQLQWSAAMGHGLRGGRAQHLLHLALQQDVDRLAHLRMSGTAQAR